MATALKKNRLTGRVLITGGAGFIARAIYQRALSENWTATFIPVSRRDGPLREVLERFPNVEAVRRVDVDDLHLLQATVEEYQPDLIIHAAAAKYVDISEANAWDTQRVNVQGSMNVAIAAFTQSIPRCVAISTDKACQPVNTYGATKFMMERLFQEAERWSSPTIFSVARYGNVIGSTGSALPRMREQARTGKPVTVTNPDMTRFWMTPQEAVDTVLEATRAPGGTVTIPTGIRASTLLTAVHAAVGDMGLAKVGERAGEKSDELLLTENEWLRTNLASGPYLYLEPPTSTVKREGGIPVALTSAAPWAGQITAAQISDALEEALTI
jgi:UDP-N-acetylglucosamine 4,6-dehydratase